MGSRHGLWAVAAAAGVMVCTGAAAFAAPILPGDLMVFRMGDGARLRLLANLSDRGAANASEDFKGILIWGSALSDSVPPWSVCWRIEP